MKYLPALILMILAATASGSEYLPLTVPTRADITKVFFVDKANGWAATSAGEVLSTYDGGKTWKIKQVTNRAIADIAIRNRQGYLTGERGLLMKTTDGGVTWQDISLNIKFNFTALGIVNDTAAIICGTDQNSLAKTVGVTFRTVDRGKSWQKRPFLGNGLSDIVVWSPRKVYVLGIKKAFHSINVGENYWTGKYEGNRLGYAFDLQDDWGYLVGAKGLFLKTTDHGRNWKDVPMQITRDLYAVAMFDHFSGVAAGEGGIVVNFSQSGDQYAVEDIGRPVAITTIAVTEDRIFFAGKGGAMFCRQR